MDFLSPYLNVHGLNDLIICVSYEYLYSLSMILLYYHVPWLLSPALRIFLFSLVLLICLFHFLKILRPVISY